MDKGVADHPSVQVNGQPISNSSLLYPEARNTQ
jgi:hypothetical protein